MQIHRPSNACPLALLLALPLCAVLAQAPPTPAPQGQNGVIQEPLRLCVLHNFGVVKGEPTQYMITSEETSITQGPFGDRDFYGATSTGGEFNAGSIYRVPFQDDVIKADDSSSVIASFNIKATGAAPEGGVILGPENDLFGTTYGGGSKGVGSVFKVPRGSSPQQISTVVSFGEVKTTAPLSLNPQPTAEDLKNVNGGWPISPLTLGNDNNLYGVTQSANGVAGGTIYRVSPVGLGSLEYLYIFMPLGDKDYGMSPYTITAGNDGMLYGTTLAGGNGFGVVFQFNPALSGAAAIKTIYKFREHMPNADDDDGTATNRLIQGPDGTLYGTNRLGGPLGRGTVFSLSLAGKFKRLYAFSGEESNPDAGLVFVHQKVPTVRPPAPNNCAPPNPSPAPPPPLTAADEADYLYGVATSNGVAFGGYLGIIFRMRTDGSDFATVYNFDSQSGAAPNVTPVLAADNNLYGSTAGGGPGYTNGGVFYRLNTDYMVTGVEESGILYGTTDQQRNKINFQGSALTRIYNNPFMQVTTDIAAFRSDKGITACKQAEALHGIIVRMKDPTSKVIQLLYRERFHIVPGPNGSSTLQPVTGLMNTLNDQILPVFDPDTTYAANTLVGMRQQDGTYLAFTSLVDNNKGKPPGFNPTFWALDQPVCGGAAPVHTCYPLTTSESYPNWVPDVEHGSNPADPNSPLYSALDTQLDCDGIQIFDTPSFIKDPTIEQHFTAIDLDIVTTTVNGVSKSTVGGAVTWRIIQHGTDDPKYLVPSLAGPPDATTLNTLRAVLVRYGFTPGF